MKTREIPELSESDMNRFVSNVSAHPGEGTGGECWEWEGARTKAGYGAIRINGQVWLSHRISWALANGPIPNGLYILHKCDNPGCVNPEHLWAGTQSDNLMEAHLMARMLAVYNGKNKRFRRDGDEFKREAHKWAAASPTPVALYDVRDGRVREKIRTEKDGLDVLAIFDHGTPKGLPRMRESYKCVKGLAETIAGVTDKITIILYACGCGRGWWWRKWRNKRDMESRIGFYNPRDGYAVALTCELTKLGVDAQVYAHLTAGHTTRNPHVVHCEKNKRHGDPEWEVWRRGVMQGSSWKQWRADMNGPLRFTFWKS